MNSPSSLGLEIGLRRCRLDDVSGLSNQQRAWVEHDERLWERANEIVASRPELDVQGVYHVLRNLERSPSERLRRALSFGRLRAQSA